MRVLPKKTNLRILVHHPLVFTRTYAGALLVLLAGALADTVTTYEVIRSYGADVELHPAQRLLFNLFTPRVAVPLAKGIQLCFVILVAGWWRRWCGWVLVTCGVFYALAAMSNHFGWL